MRNSTFPSQALMRNILTVVCVLVFLTTVCMRWGNFPLNFKSEGNGHWFQRKDRSIITSTVSSQPSTAITLFVRMSGKSIEHRRRFYCDFFRTVVLYWPASFGKMVILLDQESQKDHVFARNFSRQIKNHFPNRRLEVLYESLPEDPRVLAFPSSPKTPGYNRQLWSSFFIDLYTQDSIVAWMDNDVSFVTPVLKSSIFKNSRLRVLGTDCSFVDNWVPVWAETTELTLGLPLVADFMTYFPVYIYRDTFTNCRQHILRRFKTNNFEDAFRKFYKNLLTPVSIILSYAWYFERERYDWNFKICSDLTEYNKRLPSGYTISPEQVTKFLSQPQTAYHVSYAKFLAPNIFLSYCLSHWTAKNNPEICLHSGISLKRNYVLLNYDLQRVKNGQQTQCPADDSDVCWRILRQHYEQVAREMRNGQRKLDWSDVRIVEQLANDVDIKCYPIHR